MDKQCPPSSGLEDVHPPTYPPSPSPSAAAWSRVSACGQIFPTFSRQRTIIKHQPSLPLGLPSKGYSLQPRKTQFARKLRSKDSPHLPLPGPAPPLPPPSGPSPSFLPPPLLSPAPQESGGTWQAISSPINLWCNN